MDYVVNYCTKYFELICNQLIRHNQIIVLDITLLVLLLFLELFSL